MRAAAEIERDDLRGDGGPVFVQREGPTNAARPGRRVTHPFAVLALYTGGRARIRQGTPWDVQEGDLLLVPAGQPHQLLESRAAELWAAGFCVTCFASHDEAHFLEPFERVRAGASAVMAIPFARHEFVAGLFRELERVTTEQPRESTLTVQRSLLTLLLAEAAGLSVTEPALPASRADVVSASLRIIQRRCLGPLCLAEIGRAVGRSPAYVTTALRRATGRTAGEWIVAGRMAEARRRLLHSDEFVDVIAERVGYADPTHFIRMFRREHAETPAAWRARRRSSR